MLRTSLFLGCLFTLFSVESQTIWTETFGAGSAARGTTAVGYPSSSGGSWSQTVLGAEGGSANQWYVSGEECGNAAGSCGSACSNGDASLHISAIGGLCGTPDCGAAYDESGPANATNKRIESPIINTTGYGTLTLNFNYIAAQGDDNFNVQYSCNGGVSWTVLSTPAATQCCSCLEPTFCAFFGICCAPQVPEPCSGGGQGRWTAYSIALPVCAENIANLKIGFHWTNDGDGIGIDPSVAIDDIAVSSAMPLPVTLVNFQAAQNGKDNLVTWQTSSEVNNSHFDIMHSEDGVNFQLVGRAQGNGTSTAQNSYQWNHLNVAFGEHFYRLKQVDFDGNHVYSQTILVRKELSEIEPLFLFPNPTLGQLKIHYFNDFDAEVVVSVIDITGRTIQKENRPIERGLQQLEMDVSSLENGPYFLSISSGNRLVTAPFVKN